MTGTRIDKWLWAARFFKTRSMAAKACDLSRVTSHGQPVKPARDLHIGDMLQVETPGGKFEIEVLALSDTRGSAAVAQTLYRETEESKTARLREAEQRRMNRMFTPAPPTRPSKRDRRLIHRFRGE